MKLNQTIFAVVMAWISAISMPTTNANTPKTPVNDPAPVAVIEEVSVEPIKQVENVNHELEIIENTTISLDQAYSWKDEIFGTIISVEEVETLLNNVDATCEKDFGSLDDYYTQSYTWNNTKIDAGEEWGQCYRLSDKILLWLNGAEVIGSDTYLIEVSVKNFTTSTFQRWKFMAK